MSPWSTAASACFSETERPLGQIASPLLRFAEQPSVAYTRPFFRFWPTMLMPDPQTPQRRSPVRRCARFAVSWGRPTRPPRDLVRCRSCAAAQTSSVTNRSAGIEFLTHSFSAPGRERRFLVTGSRKNSALVPDNAAFKPGH